MEQDDGKSMSFEHEPLVSQLILEEEEQDGASIAVEVAPEAMATESDADPRPPAQGENELDEYLEDTSCWKSFEDVEDEVHYLRHRGDALARGLIAAREEISRLHEAGHRLQQAYESLHEQYREVSADAVYWQSLADARAVSAPPPAGATSVCESRLSAVDENASPELRRVDMDVSEVAPESTSPADLDPREALRRAAVEAAAVLQKKGVTRKKKVEAMSPGLAKGVAAQSPTKLKGRDFESMLTRTPPQRITRSEEGSPSPCTPGLRSLTSSLNGGYLTRASMGGRQWGIGSSPKRCPGLGTPTRRGKVDCDVSGPRSPLIRLIQKSPPTRRIRSASTCPGH